MSNPPYTDGDTAGEPALPLFVDKPHKNPQKEALALKYLETNRLLEKFSNTLLPFTLDEHKDQNIVNETFYKKATEILEAWNNDLNEIKIKSQKLEEKIQCLKPTEFRDNNPVAVFQKIASHFAKSNHTITKQHENELDQLKEIFRAEAKSIQNNYYHIQVDDKNSFVQNWRKGKK